MAAPYSGLYAEINAGAHRKAADLVGAPALIWHQTLWTPVHDQTSRESRAETLQACIKDLHGKLTHARVIPPDPGELGIDKDDRARVITLNFCWHAVQTKVRFEVHSEYLTITSVLDLSIDLSATLGSSPEELARTDPIYRELKERLEGLIHHFHCLAKDSGSTTANGLLPSTYEYLYERLWEDRFDPELLAPIAEAFLAKAPPGTPPEMAGFARIADFRGLITCERYPGSPPGPDLSSAEFLVDYPLQGPFYKAEEGLRGWQRTSLPGEAWARARLDAARPFLTCVEERVPGRLEYSVSGFLGGRMLYVTALGPQWDLGQADKKPRPLFYYLHSSTQCEREIGRVVDRLCQLGTNRLAAILVLPALQKIVEPLRKLELEVNSVRSRVHDLICETEIERSKDKAKSKARQAISKEIAGRLALIQKEISGISAGDDVEENKYLGKQTLEFRLERSRYYKEQFYFLLKDMRIERLEGYQSYPEFVNRRLGGALGYIQGFEQRIKDIRASWRVADQLFLAASVTALTSEIEASQDQESSIQQDIRELQIIGEVALFFVLAPYYAFNLGLHIFDCGGAEERCEAEKQLDFGVLGTVNYTDEQLMLVSILVLFMALFAVIRRKKIFAVVKKALARKKEAGGTSRRDTSGEPDPSGCQPEPGAARP